MGAGDGSFSKTPILLNPQQRGAFGELSSGTCAKVAPVNISAIGHKELGGASNMQTRVAEL